MSTEPRPARPRRAPADDGWLVIGLVGRAGSGKTTVARTLAEQGASVVSADRIGHQVTDADPEVRAALSAEYGADVYRPDGALDRGRVAAKVFDDPAARRRLDQLVHPRILDEIRRRIAGLREAEPSGVVVVDAALMLEWGLEHECDAVVAVVASEAHQIERLTRSRGWSEGEARRRLAAQRTNQAFAAAADVTIENDGSEEDLRRAALAALTTLRSRRGG